MKKLIESLEEAQRSISQAAAMCEGQRGGGMTRDFLEIARSRIKDGLALIRRHVAPAAPPVGEELVEAVAVAIQAVIERPANWGLTAYAELAQAAIPASQAPLLSTLEEKEGEIERLRHLLTRAAGALYRARCLPEDFAVAEIVLKEASQAFADPVALVVEENVKASQSVL